MPYTPIPENYRKSPASLISLDFVEAATGTGFVTYYAGEGLTNSLSNNVFFSNTVITTGGLVDQTSYTKELEMDFNVEFTIPQTIEGTAIVEVPVGLWTASATSDSQWMYITARIKNSAVEIATANSPIWATGAWGTGYKYQMRTVHITVPKTRFKKGDTLRLTVEYWAKGNAATAKTTFIGHDPEGRATSDSEALTFGTEPSILKFQFPMRVEQ